MPMYFIEKDDKSFETVFCESDAEAIGKAMKGSIWGDTAYRVVRVNQLPNDFTTIYGKAKEDDDTGN